MNDLEQRLARLGDAPTPTGPADGVVDADLGRARRALRERRARHVTFGSLATLGVAAVAGVVIGTTSHGDDAPTVLPAPAPSASASASDSTPPATGHPTTSGHPTAPAPPTAPPAGIRLVDYSGPQTPGFEVSTIPDGFVLQGADNVSLAVARPGDRTGIFDFRHKIVVSVQLVSTHGPLDPKAEHIEVQGHDGTIAESGDGTLVIFYQLDAKRLAFIQAWKDVGISKQQLEDFADGLSIADDVETVS